MIRLLHKTILVRRLEVGEQAKSGLFLPSAARELPQLGHITHTGARVTTLAPGDLVIFPKHWDRLLLVEGEELLWMEEKDVLGKVEP